MARSFQKNRHDVNLIEHRRERDCFSNELLVTLPVKKRHAIEETDHGRW
jgi:hypothetical protein